MTEAQQARYLGQAVAIARKDPRVKMFVWFVFRDSTLSSWQSGLYRLDGTPKPAAGVWPYVAGSLDARNGRVTARGGTVGPFVSAQCVSSAPTIRRAPESERRRGCA